MRRISVADYFVEFFVANGVTDVFGYQGGMIAYIFDSLGKYRDKIRYHSCATEQGAALAACGYAQATHKLGVAISTSGPGFTNLLTGMANAWFDSVPVMFISGNVNTKDKKRDRAMRQLGFQEIQAAIMAKSVTKKSYEIELDTDIISCLQEAYMTAMSDRKGPVYLDLPINVCREIVETEEVINPVILESRSEEKGEEFILTEIERSERPVILAGAGIKQADSVKLFRELTELIGIPVVTTLPAIDLLPNASRYRMGYIGGTARREGGIVLQNADLVISIGTRLCSKQIGHDLSLFAPKAKKFIRIDIDETELDRKIRADEIVIRAEITALLRKLKERKQESVFLKKHEDWSDACYAVRILLEQADQTEGNRICREITELFPSDANLLLDVGKNLTYGGQSAVVKEGTEIYMSAGLGTMGYAVPAAIGAAYGNGKPTYVIVGDGGAQMNIQELNTIKKNLLPIKIIVLNNKALGNIRIFQEQYLDARYVATSEREGDYFSCDFKALAEAYGIKAHCIADRNDFMKYQDELKSSEAVLFEVIYEDCPVLPGIVAGGDFLGEDAGLDHETIQKVKAVLEQTGAYEEKHDRA